MKIKIVDLRAQMPGRGNTAGGKKREIWGIAVHHSATADKRTGKPVGNAQEFFDYHVHFLGWNHGGYNYVITAEGEIQHALDDEIPAYHAGFSDPDDSAHLEFGQYWNNHYLAICLAGWFDENRTYHDEKGGEQSIRNRHTHPNVKQMRALVGLILHLQQKYGIPAERVKGHRELDGTATVCPGGNFDLRRLRNELQERAASHMRVRVVRRKNVMGIVRRSLKKLVKGAFTWLVPKMRLVAHMVILGLIVSLAAAFSHPPAILNILLRVMLSCLCLGIASVILLRWINPPTSAFMIRSRSALRKAGKDDTIITQWVNYENCPMHLALAVIAAEDWNFYDHAGFDPESILNNWRNNRTGREIRGASTISQQLSKNLFLWPARSYFRKFIEAVITVFIEAALSKKRILEIYLNIIQFDAHLFGVGAAARYFFHKEVAELDEEEAALMAAVLINPIKYRVDAPSPLVRRRQAEILQTMNDRPLGAGVGTVA